MLRTASSRNSQLVSKVYFPRHHHSLRHRDGRVSIDFGVSLVILVGVMAWYGVMPDWHIHAAAGLRRPGGAGGHRSGAVGGRDDRQVSRLSLRHSRSSVQVGLYVSPVGFSAKVVPPEWQLLYSVNPMVGVIDGFRWAILGGDSPLYLPGFAVSMLVAAGMLWLGIHTFRRTERGFADLI
jgi:lipopolysaccharide transport system permease protein